MTESDRRRLNGVVNRIKGLYTFFDCDRSFGVQISVYGLVGFLVLSFTFLHSRAGAKMKSSFFF